MTHRNVLQQKRRDIQDRLRKVQGEISGLESEGFSSDITDAESTSAQSPEVARLRAVEQRILAQRGMIDGQIGSDISRLRKLQHWLTIESVGGISLVLLAKGSFYLGVSMDVPFIYWYSFLIVAALVFTPFMVLTIARSGHRGWLVAFALVVCLPCVLMFLPIHDPFFELAFQLLPLLMFYAFCWTLRYAVSDWLSY